MALLQSSDPFQPVNIDPGYPEPRATIDPDQGKGWIKRLVPLVKSHPRILVVGIIFGIVALGAQAIVPYLGRLAIDAAGEGNRDNLTRLIIILSILPFLRAIAGTIYRSAFFKLAFRIDADLRSLLYSHLTRLSFSFYDRTVSGEVVSRANSDIRSIQILFAFAPLGITSLLIFVIALGLMLTIHIPLTLIALSTLPVVYYLGARFRDIVFPLSWITQARLAEVATIVDESANGTHIVKAFSAEKNQVRLLARAARRVQWSTTETIYARARYNPAIEALPKLGMAAVLGYGGWLVIDGQVSIGTLFAFNAYVIMSLVPFRMLGFLIAQARRSAAAAQRVYEILDSPVDLEDSPDAFHLQKPAGHIEFKDVYFSYPSAHQNNAADSGAEPAERAQVLSGVSFSVNPGETVAIVGATGSGKTSIARLMARFYDVSSGEVLIDEINVKSVTQTSLHHYVGIAFDDPFLFSMSLADNIAFARPDASIEDIQLAAKKAQAHDFITRLPEGYETVIGERGYTLSGGQRQRVALARIFIANPAVLILDDATSAVDVETESRIHTEIKKHTSTILVIAHRLSTIALADRILLLDNGIITDSGTHLELLDTNPRYREILAEAAAASVHTDSASDGNAANGNAADGNAAAENTGGANASGDDSLNGSGD